MRETTDDADGRGWKLKASRFARERLEHVTRYPSDMITALALAALTQAPTTLELFRGAPLATPAYWDVEDTYLDPRDPDASFGGSYTLLGGPDRPLLIRFGDLNRVVGPHRRIKSASLVLTSVGGDAPKLASVGRVLVPWGEGPMTTLSRLLLKPPTPTDAAKPNAKSSAPAWAATYRQRRGGSIGWQEAGAKGNGDVRPVEGATLVARGDAFAIEGLGPTMQGMLDHPLDNHGIAIGLSTESEFNSSQAASGRPRLVLELEDAPAKTGADLSVIRIDRSPADAKPGQSVTYTAHIKNVGDAPSSAFVAAWSVGEKPGTTQDVKTPVAPGEEVTVTLSKPLEVDAADHRIHPIALRISAEDACLANNDLEIDEGATPVTVILDAPTAARLAKETNALGSHSLEDWAQAQVRLWNETYASQSRFSFAPEGAKERVRLAEIKTDGTTMENVASTAACLPVLRSFALQVGLDDGHRMSVPPGAVKLPESATRASVDRFPGLTGYGDTRFEGGIPGNVELPYEPVTAPIFETAFLEPTDLLCETEVGALNARLGAANWNPIDTYRPMPRVMVLRVTDLTGRPLPDTDLEFYQSEGGEIRAAQPAFTARTDARGQVTIPSRGDFGPFGTLTPGAGNGVLMVRGRANGVVECGWIKAWQLTDASRRGSFAAAVMDLRLNLPDRPLVADRDLALDRIATDSTDDEPAKLQALVDGKDTTEIALPEKAGGWVELDLGRDRTIGEIALITRGKPFWSRFDVTTYSTGQRPEDGNVWARELDWGWTSTNRRDPGPSADSSSVAYRNAATRIRYVRIVNRSGGRGSLVGIRVVPAKLTP